MFQMWESKTWKERGLALPLYGWMTVLSFVEDIYGWQLSKIETEPFTLAYSLIKHEEVVLPIMGHAQEGVQLSKKYIWTSSRSSSKWMM